MWTTQKHVPRWDLPAGLAGAELGVKTPLPIHWKEPESPGSSTRTSTELVISRNGQEKRTLNETLLPGQTDYIIPKTPSEFYTPNTDLKAFIQAVSKVGSSVTSSDAFVLPGRKNPIVCKSFASTFSLRFGCSL